MAVNVALASEPENPLSIIALWGAPCRSIMGPVRMLKGVYKRFAYGGWWRITSRGDWLSVPIVSEWPPLLMQTAVLATPYR